MCGPDGESIPRQASDETPDSPKKKTRHDEIRHDWRHLPTASCMVMIGVVNLFFQWFNLSRSESNRSKLRDNAFDFSSFRSSRIKPKASCWVTPVWPISALKLRMEQEKQDMCQKSNPERKQQGREKGKTFLPKHETPALRARMQALSKTHYQEPHHRSLSCEFGIVPQFQPGMSQRGKRLSRLNRSSPTSESRQKEPVA